MTERLRPFPIPANDKARARAVAEMDLHAFREDPFFFYVTDAVKSIFGVPVAFVSLFTEDDQEFLACQGLDIPGTPRTHSLCAYTVAARETIIIPNALKDPRAFQHPVVVQMGLRFSASAPVILSNGFCMGTVCGVDLTPHDPPNDAQIAQLNALAGMVARFYEAPRAPDPDHIARMEKIAQDAQETFLKLIGHELRTPLNGIHGMAQVLDPATEEDADVVDAIVHSSEHLDGIISSILAFTEIGSGDVQLDEGQIALDTALENAVRAHRKLAQLRGKDIHIGQMPPGVTLHVDARQIELALSCLVNNCVAHGGTTSEISSAFDEDGTLSITLRDNGQGISEDRRDDIWNAFRVGDDVHNRNADGLGLGLPLSRCVIDLHGGDIRMENEADALAVTLRLPAWRVQQEASAQSA